MPPAMTNDDYSRGWADGYMTAWRRLAPDDLEPTEELTALDQEPPTVPDRAVFRAPQR